MAQTALPAPRVVPAARRRAFFGLFAADGWPWAIVKALGWFIIIIILLAYIPDRAYYFTVQKTVDLGLLVWSPVNFCPPENETLPCPAPAGSTLPWHPSPGEIQFPAGRTDGAAALIGTTYLYAGGSDGKAAVATTFVSHAVGLGNLDKWSEGPKLPAPALRRRLRRFSGTLSTSSAATGPTAPRPGRPTASPWAPTGPSGSGRWRTR